MKPIGVRCNDNSSRREGLHLGFGKLKIQIVEIKNSNLLKLKIQICWSSSAASCPLNMEPKLPEPSFKFGKVATDASCKLLSCVFSSTFEPDL